MCGEDRKEVSVQNVLQEKNLLNPCFSCGCLLFTLEESHPFTSCGPGTVSSLSARLVDSALMECDLVDSCPLAGVSLGDRCPSVAVVRLNRHEGDK